MTMLDDDRLASVLADAARRFDLPEDGPAAIMALARSGGSRPDAEGEADGEGAGEGDGANGIVGPTVRIAPFRRVAGAAQRHRFATVAASVVALLVALATVGALTRPNPSRSISSLAPRASAHAPSHAPPSAALPTPSAENPTAGPSHATTGGAFGTGSKNGGAPLSTHANSGPASAGAPSSAPLPNNAVGRSSRIQQSGTLTLTVTRGTVSRTVNALTALAASNGGFVANSQTNSGADSAPGGSVTLEVPVNKFAAVLKEAEALGRPSGVSTKATDVTGQYVDLQARIGALQSSRQQYLTILARATTIGDVLSVQEQIDTIQSQIEQLQGQLQVLTNETAYSTLTAMVNQTTSPPPPSPVPESGLIQAWHQSVGGFVDGVDGVVRLAGPTLFVLVCLAGVLVGGRVLWRRYRRHSL
jgi:hypothetical protein